MTNEEAIERASRPQTEIDKRIADGLIPPAPDYVNEHAKWIAWYDANIPCRTPSHRYFLRERGSHYCAQCIADGTAERAALTKAVESHWQMGVSNNGPQPLLIPTTDGREVCCAGALHDASTHTDECSPEKRDAATPAPAPRAARKPRAMPT
jgi:hypothetical protein